MLFDDLTQRVNKGRVTELRWLLWAALQAKHGQTFPEPESVSGLIDKMGGVRAFHPILRELLTRNKDDDPPKVTGDGEAQKDERPGSTWRRLYLDARDVDVPEQTFWDLSLRELWLELAAGRQRRKYDSDRIKTQAWWIAMLVWQKKLPDLSALISRAKEPRTARKQTWQEMRDIFRIMAAPEPKKLVKGT